MAEENEDYYILSEVNEAVGLKQTELDRIGQEVKDGFDADFDSTQSMRKKMVDIRGILEKSSDSSAQSACKVNLPNLHTAITKFKSTATNNLLKNTKSPTRAYAVLPEFKESAVRVQRYFNNHIKNNTDLFESYAKSFYVLARDGFYVRKVFWDKGPQSELVLPEDFVIAYNSISLESSYRYSQILHFTQNEIEKRMKSKLWIKHDPLPVPTENQDRSLLEESMRNRGIENTLNSNDYADVIDVVECHTYIKLKGDDCRKPRIVTFNRSTGQVYRITPRWKDEKGYDPIHYFVTVSCVTNPNSIYGYGFGHLFYSSQKTINTIMRQIIDAQTLNLMPPMFLDKRTGLSGDYPISPGKINHVNTRADEVKKAFSVLNFPAPSPMLYNSIQLLVSSMNEFTSQTEIANGQAPRSDTTATAAEIAIEKSEEMFTSIQRSIHLAITKEFGIMKDLMERYLIEDDYFKTMQMVYEGVIATQDIEAISKIELIADPNQISERQALAKAEYLHKVIMENPLLANNLEAQKLDLESRLNAIGEDEDTIQELLAQIDKEQERQEMAQEQAQKQAEQQTYEDTIASQVDADINEAQVREQRIADEVQKDMDSGKEVV
tara:strand:- start:23593 stop:25413 length:1821 start_codon:yes stop_codon:yes gene_type:complete